MAYLTIFTAPKPFTNPHINIIQRNAIQSWMHLGPDVEVFLVGEEEGMAEVAAEYGIKHLPDVVRNEWGTPLVSSIFGLARENTQSPLMAYINADILIMPDFVEAARRVEQQAKNFLVVGQRWDLDVTELMDFPEDWVDQLRRRVQREGKMHAPAGSDYFIYPRDQYVDMPPFAIGRPSWDNWMIYSSRKQGWATVDATPDVMIVHQNHDYSHLPGGKPPYRMEEGQRNIALARGRENEFTGYLVLETDRQLRDGKVVSPKMTSVRLLRRLELLFMPGDVKSGIRFRLSRYFRKWWRKITDSQD